MKELNLEMAGGFLVMASTLMQIKAQMLLPSPDAEQDEGPDPRAEFGRPARLYAEAIAGAALKRAAVKVAFL